MSMHKGSEAGGRTSAPAAPPTPPPPPPPPPLAAPADPAVGVEGAWLPPAAPAPPLPPAALRVFALGAPMPQAGEIGDAPVVVLGTENPEPPIIGVAPFATAAKAAESLEESELSTNTPLCVYGLHSSVALRARHSAFPDPHARVLLTRFRAQRCRFLYLIRPQAAGHSL